MEEGC